ncbi:hypothetical protein C7212DRAFT_347806 [Tuber magnatum]|uniref:Uncharacterized protein n=1 Tax=Tuber magnatum TaxID=42249 RepID=A0A317SG87_9PEZI|nr:hypothetical protein C7212DRAFT_347806 [Tuber magnatum]
MSGFISYSGGAPDFCPPYKKKPQNGFVWWRALITVYGVRPTYGYPRVHIHPRSGNFTTPVELSTLPKDRKARKGEGYCREPTLQKHPYLKTGLGFSEFDLFKANDFVDWWWVSGNELGGSCAVRIGGTSAAVPTTARRATTSEKAGICSKRGFQYGLRMDHCHGIYRVAQFMGVRKTVDEASRARYTYPSIVRSPKSGFTSCMSIPSRGASRTEWPVMSVECCVCTGSNPGGIVEMEDGDVEARSHL